MIFGSCFGTIKITSNWTDTLLLFLEVYVAILGDLDTMSFVTDATSNESLRPYKPLAQKSIMSFTNSQTFW